VLADRRRSIALTKDIGFEVIDKPALRCYRGLLDGAVRRPCAGLDVRNRDISTMPLNRAIDA